jgi:hypothetical protein
VHQSNVRRVISQEDFKSIVERLESQGIRKAFKRWKIIVAMEKTRMRNIGIIINSMVRRRQREVMAKIKGEHAKA